MKKFFIDSLYSSDRSVAVREFKTLPNELIHKEVEMTPEMGICAILDTETTGLDFEKDEIIEIAIRQWVYHKKEHYLIKPLSQYSSLHEPVRNEISELITDLTGITKEDVAGQKIDWELVNKILGGSDFIMAHNAGFDRPMIEAVPELKEMSASKIWTCSFKQVDWDAQGFLSAKQELLCLFHGFHYSGHRALTDIDALGNLLMKGDYLKEILTGAKTKQVQVNAVKAPFDAKDNLKGNGFFWNAPAKYWSKIIPETEKEEMKVYLADEIYPSGKMNAQFKVIELRDRFKS